MEKEISHTIPRLLVVPTAVLAIPEVIIYSELSSGGDKDNPRRSDFTFIHPGKGGAPGHADHQYCLGLEIRYSGHSNVVSVRFTPQHPERKPLQD